MISIPKPADSIEVVYDACCATIRDRAKKTYLLTGKQEVVQDTLNYDRFGPNANLHRIVPTAQLRCGISKDDMEWLYNVRFSNAKDCRIIYDRIMLSAPFNKCPYCGRGNARTLDHYLPKSTYPSLAVSPINLVPCCYDCNFSKSETQPTSSEDLPIHPYYDDFSAFRWLFAESIRSTPVTFRYFIRCPDGTSDVTVNRLNNHLRSFNLFRDFAIEAASEFTSIDDQIRLFMSEADEDAIRAHILAVAQLEEVRHKNSWKTALYYSLLESDWYSASFA